MAFGLGGVPGAVGDLSPEMIARLLQQGRSQDQATGVLAPLFDRAPMAPAQSFGGTSGTIVPPAQPGGALSGVLPGPQATGALGKPPAASDDDDEAAPPSPNAPSARTVPLPPARPAEFGGEGMRPVDSFDPLSGQAVSGSPKLVAPPGMPGAGPAGATAPSASPGFSLGGLFDRLSQSGVGDQMMAMAGGLLQGKNFGEGLGKAFEAAGKASALGAATRLADAKTAQAQATLSGNAAVYKQYHPNASPEELLAGSQNSAIMTDLFKRGLPATETYKQDKDEDGNIWQTNSSNGQRSLLKGADKDDVQLITDPVTGTVRAVRKSEIFPDRVVGASAAQQVGAPSTAEPANGADSNVRTVFEGNRGFTPLTNPTARLKAGIRQNDDRAAWMGADGKVTFEPGAPSTTINMDLGKKAAGEADAQILKKIDTSYDKAQGAVGTLDAIGRQKQAIDRGMISGWGADWQTQARAMSGKLLGLSDDEVANAQTFDAASKQKGAELAKAISAAGHTTNMDLGVGTAIAGGDRSKTEQSIRAIIDAQEVLARKAIEHHNAGVDRYVKGAPDMGERMGWYRVETPSVYQYGQGTPNPVADPGSAPVPVSRTIGNKTYSKGPDGHWYEAR